jgi:hypothetical protein
MEWVLLLSVFAEKLSYVATSMCNNYSKYTNFLELDLGYFLRISHWMNSSHVRGITCPIEKEKTF